MSEPRNKKQKMDRSKKKYHAKQYSPNKPKYLEVGQSGFLITCNFREKDCIRESYRLLNEYADELYGKTNVEKEEKSDEEDDIVKQLENQIAATKVEVKEKSNRFMKVETGTTNCLFIQAKIDARELGIKIVQDLIETQKKKSKFILRFVPVSAICKAKVEDIVECCGPLCDKFFLKEPSTFSIVFNKRYNNEIKRDQVIKAVADLVSHKNINNKVDLGNPQLTVLIEVIKGLCAIAILPKYVQYKKYNLNELFIKESTAPDIRENEEKNSIPEKTDEQQAEKKDTNAENGDSEANNKD